MFKMSRYLSSSLWVVVLLGSGFLILRQELTTKLYQHKIEELSAEYTLLSEQYNAVVKQTAVTELEVTPTSLAVLVRSLDGTVRRLDTPFHPSEEIYIDYIVKDSRIWIRRVFDAQTPPEAALIVDPTWASVDWSEADYAYGKAIYRSLSPGTWSIQVTGNGALSLLPVSAEERPLLAYSPGIDDFTEWKAQMDAERRDIGLSEIWGFLFSLLPG